ncbi:MAG: hypothetical protein L6R40_000383 [Gallowayella cf. fulva]|nr:MAG: hypothetical protein L6R40_000383 [Xanthomendoza cf. fulva]
MPDADGRQKVLVVGAGPVGALAALYAAGRGDDVEVYELRDDLRDPSTTPLNFTKSINLALSERGVNAMRHARCEGLLDAVIDESIPMHGRMIHGQSRDGKLYEEPQVYDAQGRYIRAVDRAALNKRLLDYLEQMPNVSLHFNHKLTGADFRKNVAWFEQQTVPKIDHAQNPTGNATEKTRKGRSEEISVHFDFMIGADGAHSAARFHMMKFARLAYQQEYIDTLWCEFHINPRTSDSSFAISPDHLHIWPGGSYMFIAIPSLDKSFTCTLFAPESYFTALAPLSSEEFVSSFSSRFPGVCPELISPEELYKQFIENPHLPLLSIKCTPYHYRSSVVILGDAAHAMVPFYGQGMNAGLEDVRVLFDFLDAYDVYNDTPKLATTRKERRAGALNAYTSQRTPDAAAINDLALRNYQEMSAGVRSPVYRLRKWLEETVSVYLPTVGWSTQYSRVSFGNQRYSEVERATARQGKIMVTAFCLGLTGLTGLAAFGLLRWDGSRSLRALVGKLRV